MLLPCAAMILTFRSLTSVAAHDPAALVLECLLHHWSVQSMIEEQALLVGCHLRGNF